MPEASLLNAACNPLLRFGNRPSILPGKVHICGKLARTDKTT